MPFFSEAERISESPIIFFFKAENIIMKGLVLFILKGERISWSPSNFFRETESTSKFSSIHFSEAERISRNLVEFF